MHFSSLFSLPLNYLRDFKIIQPHILFFNDVLVLLNLIMI